MSDKSSHPFFGLATNHTAAGLAGQIIADAISLTVKERVELGVLRELERRDTEEFAREQDAQDEHNQLMNLIRTRGVDLFFRRVAPRLLDYVLPAVETEL